MHGSINQVRLRIKPIDREYDQDYDRWDRNRKQYKGITAKPENRSFHVFHPVTKKYSGSRKTLDEAVQLLAELSKSEANHLG
jgi:hypothetical protein